MPKGHRPGLRPVSRPLFLPCRGGCALVSTERRQTHGSLFGQLRHVDLVVEVAQRDQHVSRSCGPSALVVATQAPGRGRGTYDESSGSSR